MYSKLFASILDSSVWLEPMPTRIVWLTLLAAKDADGFARFATAENVALRARVTIPEAEAALATLESPDQFDPTQEHEGRRIERVSGGWIVLNAKLYDEMVRREDQRKATRLRVRRHREKAKQPEPAAVATPPAHLASFGSDTERFAYEHMRGKADNGESFDAMLATIAKPISGGPAYPWHIIGQVMIEMHSSNAKPNAAAIRAFCRRLLKDREPPEHRKPTSKQERGREALATTLRRHGFANGPDAPNPLEVPRTLPRTVPDAGTDRPHV